MFNFQGFSFPDFLVGSVLAQSADQGLLVCGSFLACLQKTCYRRVREVSKVRGFLLEWDLWGLGVI